MKAHGFTVDQLIEFLRFGLAIATPRRVKAGGETMEVVTFRITDAGQKALGR